MSRGEDTRRTASPSAFAVPRTTFVGGAEPLATVSALLGEHQLVTLVGSGGCGKTRLALEVATRIEPTFSGGAAFVDLAPIDSEHLVASAVAAAAGVTEAGAGPLPDLIANALADRHLLLVLDNCERLVAGCAELVDALLQRCPQLVVAATSRSPLGVEGEVTWRVPSLPLPEPGSVDPLAALGASGAGRLLLDRVRLVRPGFTPTSEDAAAMVTLCHRLDGIPLAIELAAGRLRALDPSDLVDGMGDRFGLLSNGPRTAPPRQQTLELSIDWSHDLLDGAQQTLFRRLGVFAAGFTIDAAVAVCTGDGIAPHDVRPLVADLVDQSLVQRRDDGGTFRLLESVREYAQRRLAEAGEEVACRDRHLDHVLAAAEAFDAVAEQGDLESANDRVDALLDDVRSALDWALAAGRIDDGRRIAAGLRVYWVTRSRGHEGRRWLGGLMEADASGDPDTAVRAQLAQAELFLEANDLVAHAAAADLALEGATALGNDRLRARGLVLAGWARMYTDPPRAASLLDEAHHLAEELHDLPRVRSACFGLSVVRGTGGGLAQASDLLAKGIAIEEQSDGYYLQWGLGTAGYVHTLAGEIGPALRELRAATSSVRHPRYRTGRDLALTWLGLALAHHGDYDEARKRFDEAIAGAHAVGNPTVYAVLHLARLEQALANPDQALALLDEAGPLVQWLGAWFWVQALVCRADALALHDPGEADVVRSEAVEHAKAAANPLARTVAELSCARRARQLGDEAGVRRHARHALRTAVGCGYGIGAIDALEALALLPGDDAARLLAAVDAARDHCGYARFPIDDPAYVAAVDAVGGAGGEVLSFDAAVRLAMGAKGRAARPPTGWASLTPAELRVAELVAAGLTNREVGERLFTSPRTVQAHLAHSFTKLGIASRAELAAEVSRHDDVAD